MITIIDDVEKAGRAKDRMEQIRRKKGANNQKDSEARKKPWIALGIGKTTYYKHKKLELLGERELIRSVN